MSVFNHLLITYIKDSRYEMRPSLSLAAGLSFACLAELRCANLELEEDKGNLLYPRLHS